MRQQSGRTSIRELSPAEFEKEKGNEHFKKRCWSEAIAAYSAAIKLDGSMVSNMGNGGRAELFSSVTVIIGIK